MELNWFYSLEHKQLCQVINTENLWVKTYCKVWLPGNDILARVQKNKLLVIDNKYVATAEYVKYITAAARIANEINENILLSPIESSVIPLPHKAIERKK